MANLKRFRSSILQASAETLKLDALCYVLAITIDKGYNYFVKKIPRIKKTTTTEKNSLLDNNARHKTLNYRKWIQKYDRLTNQQRRKIQHLQGQFAKQPLITVILQICNPRNAWLIGAIESLQNQTYPNWELYLINNASPNLSVNQTIERYGTTNTKIHVISYSNKVCLSESFNRALNASCGEWITYIEQHDLLNEAALFWVVKEINENVNAELIYSDEDEIDSWGQRQKPYFKCDWNQDLFYSQNMIGHLAVYHADRLKQIGGLKNNLHSVTYYDLNLRFIEKIQNGQIIHIPRVLYHARKSSRKLKYYESHHVKILDAHVSAVNEHFARASVRGFARHDKISCMATYEIPSPNPLVSIIIPTKDHRHILQKCIDSIIKQTRYTQYEIIVVDNNSKELGTLAYLRELSVQRIARVIKDPKPFNYSRLNNLAAKQAKGQVLALLNNDVEVISPDWLTIMVSQAMRSEVGAVGAKLWYSDNTLQHAGLILGVLRIAGHAFRHANREDKHDYFSWLSSTRSVSAVTAACLVVQKSLYFEVNGFDEINLPIAFNDIDFCLKLQEHGYRNIWTPHAELYHHESVSRGKEDTPEKKERFNQEILYMEKRWHSQLRNDPGYNPNLTVHHEDFRLAWPPRVEII